MAAPYYRPLFVLFRPPILLPACCPPPPTGTNHAASSETANSPIHARVAHTNAKGLASEANRKRTHRTQQAFTPPPPPPTWPHPAETHPTANGRGQLPKLLCTAPRGARHNKKRTRRSAANLCLRPRIHPKYLPLAL